MQRFRPIVKSHIRDGKGLSDDHRSQIIEDIFDETDAENATGIVPHPDKAFPAELPLGPPTTEEPESGNQDGRSRKTTDDDAPDSHATICRGNATNTAEGYANEVNDR